MSHLLKIPQHLLQAYQNAVAIRDSSLETETIEVFREADLHVQETKRAIDRWRSLQESKVLAGSPELRA